MTTQKWLSVHLFYDDSLNFLLEKGIVPFIEQHQNLMFSWFFIRYMEKGQHIRLRMLVNAAAESEMKDIVTVYFNHYFNHFPSDDKVLIDGNFLNNSIQFIDYQVETERYGGTEGVLIAEQFFNQSSVLITNYIEAMTTYETVLLGAMVMNLYVGLSYNPENVATFFETIYKNWLQFNVQYLTLSESEIVIKFELIFQEQKATLTEIIEAVIQSYSDEKAVIDGFETWQMTTQTISERLKNANLSKPITMILESYIHLNNNRFGISNFDESFLAYLIWRGLSNK